MQALLSNIRRDFPAIFARDIRPVLNFAGRNWLVLSMGGVALGVFLLFRRVLAQNAALANRCSLLEERVQKMEGVADFERRIVVSTQILDILRRLSNTDRELSRVRSKVNGMIRGLSSKTVKRKKWMTSHGNPIHPKQGRFQGSSDRTSPTASSPERKIYFTIFSKLFKDHLGEQTLTAQLPPEVDKELLCQLIAGAFFYKLLAHHRVLERHKGSRKNNLLALTN